MNLQFPEKATHILTQQTVSFVPPADPAFPEMRDGRAVLYTVLSDTRAGGLSLSVHHSEAHELWTRIEAGTEDETKAAALFTRIMEARTAGDIEAEEEAYERMDAAQRDWLDTFSSDEIHVPLPPEYAAGPVLKNALEMLLKTAAFSNPDSLTSEDREAVGIAADALRKAAGNG